MPRIIKKISTPDQKRFESTRDAFANLISQYKWYSGISINGFPLNAANAAAIKHRFKNDGGKSVSIEYMEQLLLASGYEIVQPIIWEKK